MPEQKKRIFTEAGRVAIPILILAAFCFAYRTALANHLYSFATGKSLMARLPDCGDGPVVIAMPFISSSSPPLVIVVADEAVKRALIEAARAAAFVRTSDAKTNFCLTYSARNASLHTIEIAGHFRYQKADYESPRLRETLNALKTALVRRYGEQTLAELRSSEPANDRLVVIGGDKGEEIRLPPAKGAAEIVTTSALDRDYPYAKHFARTW